MWRPLHLVPGQGGDCSYLHIAKVTRLGLRQTLPTANKLCFRGLDKVILIRYHLHQSLLVITFKYCSREMRCRKLEARGSLASRRAPLRVYGWHGGDNIQMSAAYLSSWTAVMLDKVPCNAQLPLLFEYCVRQRFTVAVKAGFHHSHQGKKTPETTLGFCTM
jgi:hypothetical protein